MDISMDRFESDVDRPRLPSVVMRTMLRIVRRLVEIFSLTEADRKKAGIYIRRRRV
jgi:hypothetical protein